MIFSLWSIVTRRNCLCSLLGLTLIAACSDSPEPLLGDVTPQTLNLQASLQGSAVNVISIPNAGGATLQYNTLTDASWIELTPFSGAVGVGQTASIELTATCPATDTEQTLNSTVDITSNGGTQSIPVRITCRPLEDATPLLADLSLLSVSASTMVDQSVEAILTFSNAGTAPLDYSVTSADNWILVNPRQGSLQAATDASIAVTMACDASLGTRTGELLIETNGGNRSIPVTLQCTAAPVAVLGAPEPTRIDLNAQVNLSATAALRFSNEGTLALDYTVNSVPPWLTLSVNNGQLAPAAALELTVTAACGEDAGTLSAIIEISSNGGDASVPVTLSCTPTPIPVLSAMSPSVLSLATQQGQDTTASISFSNEGTIPLEYEIISEQDWIRTEVTEGRLAAGESITRTITATCEDTPGEQNGTLVIRSNGGSQSVPVLLTCTATPLAVLGDISPALIEVALEQGFSTERAIRFTNEGNLTLQYTVASESWIEMQVLQGSLAPGADAVLNLTFRCGAEPVARAGSILVRSNGGDRSVPVTLECTATPVAVLGDVSPAAFNLSAQQSASSTGAISFANMGTLNLEYALSSEQDWISLQTASGILSPSADTSIAMTATCDSATGVRSGAVDIRSNGGEQSVPVTLECTATPVADLSDVSPATLNLSAQQGASANGEISFANTGTISLEYTISSEQEWISLQPADGSLSPTANASIVMTATCDNSTETRSGAVDIRSNGGDQSVAVSLECTAVPLPVLRVVPPPALAAEEGASAEAVIGIANDGNAELSYSLESQSDWISVESNASGAVAVGQRSDVPVTASCEAFVGTRSGNVRVTSNAGEDQLLQVSLTCSAVPLAVLQVDPLSLSLSADEGASDVTSFEVSNEGDLALEYTLSTQQSWLSVASDKGNIAGGGEPQSVLVTGFCEAGGVSEAGVVSVKSNGGDADVNVTLECKVPVSTCVIAGEDVETMASQSECDALIAFYKSTEGERWNTANDWVTPTDPCGWSGVSCNDLGIDSISVLGDDLNGELPSEMAMLTHLTTLDFSASGCREITSEEESYYVGTGGLGGRVPVEIAALSKLSVLDLSANQLTGEIPAELRKLTHLTVLDLGCNQLSGSIPPELASLVNVETLDLGFNYLTGQIPPELSLLSSLDWLSLDWNGLSGEIPPELSALNKLRILTLRVNQLKGGIPADLSLLENLQTLDLGNNQLSGQIPEALAALSNLTGLSLDSNELTGEIPEALSRLGNLLSLSLSFNQLSGEIPASLGSMTNMFSFNVSNNQLNGQIPDELSKLSNLSTLSLSNNRLSGSIPPGLGSLTELRTLFLDSNDLSGDLSRLVGLADTIDEDPDNNRLRLVPNGCFSASAEAAAWLDIVEPGWQQDECF